MRDNFCDNRIFDLDNDILELAQEAEESCKEVFRYIERIEEYNQQKVLASFIKNKVSESDFYGSTGYGYNDKGRETLDNVFADVMESEASIVRHNFVSGTHALAIALFGVLRPGDTMLSVIGKPYDTLIDVIGIGNGGSNQGSLKDFGIKYKQIDLKIDGAVDFDKIFEECKKSKVIYIQRSKGYSLRKSLTLQDIEKICKFVKEQNKDAVIIVDNCYGEFVDRVEPTKLGADLVVGSLIKNPGGGIARTGGYIAGKRELVDMCGYRLTSPGIGSEVGCTLGETRNMLLGLFLSPQVVANALKTAVFAAKLFKDMGYDVYPKYDAERSDIIQALVLGTEKKLCNFCRGIQKGSPVDSFVEPIPWDMPGYDSQVIMAAGTFTLGASIEFSADAPIREPYAVWLQGSLTYYSGKMGIMLAAQEMNKII